MSRSFWQLPVTRIHPAWWVAIAAAMVGVDARLGPEVPFPAVYAIPVTVAAWYSGLRTSLALAITLPFARLVTMPYMYDAPWVSVTLNIAMRLFTLVVLAVFTARLQQHERRLQRDVELLTGLLPICMFCKSIREGGQWEPLEGYLKNRSGTELTHGICPACAEKHYPDAGG